ncbi:MAG TPA: SLBB domain-containing protein [Candidatus Polarisedimenticolia bacterium]|nr:SLBB domain-containing protein [Candidatus Polarisedimenticolia bacterium]
MTILRQAFGFTMLWVLTAVAAAAAPAAPAAATLNTVDFEISPQETVVRIVTSRPLPAYECDLEPGGGVVLRFPAVVSRLQPEYTSPVAYLGAVRVEAAGGPGSGPVVLRFSPRSTTLTRLETREDGLGLRFPAGGGPATLSSNEYLIGVGDKLDITVFGHDDMTRTVEVRADGSVNLPLIGDLEVAGKGARAVADELTGRLGTEFLVDPKVSVEVRDYRSHWVTLMGEVKAPGRYPLRRNMRLLDVLAEAGGPTKDAGRQVVVTSPGAGTATPQEHVVTLQDLYKAGESSDNPVLQHGDVVTVRERELFYIRGEVNRPSAYVLDTGMTLVKAIAIAGGLTPYASRKEIQVLRSGTGGAQERITLNLKAIEDGKREDLTLQSEDVIIVPRRIF